MEKSSVIKILLWGPNGKTVEEVFLRYTGLTTPPSSSYPLMPQMAIISLIIDDIPVKLFLLNDFTATVSGKDWRQRLNHYIGAIGEVIIYDKSGEESKQKILLWGRDFRLCPRFLSLIRILDKPLDEEEYNTKRRIEGLNRAIAGDLPGSVAHHMMTLDELNVFDTVIKDLVADHYDVNRELILKY